MAKFGTFTEITFVNGLPPAINDVNLNEIERVVKLTDDELSFSNELSFLRDKEYYVNRNTNYLYLFETYSEWSNVYPSQNSMSLETTNNLVNDSCLKMTNLLATAGWMSIYQTLGTAVNLSVFLDNTASSTSDIIVFWFYLSDGAAFSQFECRLGDDFSNCYFVEIADLGLATGWNAKYLPKSDFTTVGAPTGWNSISYLRFSPYVDAGYANEYIYMHPVYLHRQDPDYSGFSNIFQKYNGTTWETNFPVWSDVCACFYDWSNNVRKLGFMRLDVADDENELEIYPDLISFRSRIEIVCKTAGNTPCITWRVNASNFIQVDIHSNSFSITTLEAAVGGGVGAALTNNLLKDETVTIYFEKQDSTIRAILYKGNEFLNILQYTTSISATTEGTLFLGQYSTSSGGLIVDFSVSNKRIPILENETLPKFYRKSAVQPLISNSFVDVVGFSAYLRPYSVYKIELYLVAYNTGSATPDIQLQWVTTNCELLTNRGVIGPSTTCTDARDTNVKMSEWSTAASSYGLEGGADESLIKETFIVSTQEDGGLIKLQAAQVSTDISNPSIIKDGSWLLITPVSCDKTS